MFWVTLLCAVIATDYYRGNIITGKPVVFCAAHKVKNPNWPEAKQLAVNKGDCEELHSGIPWRNPGSS